MRQKAAASRSVFRTKRRFLLCCARLSVSKLVLAISVVLLCISLLVFRFCLVNGMFSHVWQPGSFLLTCARVVPHHLTYFAPAPIVTFSAFDQKRVFQVHSTTAMDWTYDGGAYHKDVQIMLELSENALRKFTRDSSIIVRNYSVGYWHMDRRLGSRYLLHVTSTSQKTAQLRYDVLAFHNSFNGRCRIAIRRHRADVMQQPVYMIVTYSQRPDRLKWFLDQFDTLRGADNNLKLILSLCGRNDTDTSIAMAHARKMKERESVHVTHNIIPAFNKAVCLREAAGIVSNNSLLFLTDVDMRIERPWFERCRLNAIQSVQAYFPTVYNAFPGQNRIARESGSWLYHGYGNVCMYKYDFATLAAFKDAETNFVGWGAEDLHLKQAFENHSQFEVFRAVEPALIHKWHPKECDPSSKYYRNCVNTKLRRIGMPGYLGDVLEKEKVDVQGMIVSKFGL